MSSILRIITVYVFEPIIVGYFGLNPQNEEWISGNFFLRHSTLKGSQLKMLCYSLTPYLRNADGFSDKPFFGGGPEFFFRIRTPLVRISPHLHQSATGRNLVRSARLRETREHRGEERACAVRPISGGVCQSGERGRQREESLIEIDNRGISCQIALIERGLTCHTTAVYSRVYRTAEQTPRFSLYRPLWWSG